MKKFSLFFFSFLSTMCLLSTIAYAQNDPEAASAISKIIPPSPESAALGKYVEYPVSTYTGVPNISIPIVNCNSRRLSTPVSISYNASGIKLEEVATCAGLGWSLNAGGVISRTVRGIQDDSQNGFYWDSFDETTISKEIVRDIVLGNQDGESDTYFFNAGGYSGSFFLDSQKNCVLESRQDISIRITKILGGSEFAEFEMIDPDGNIYIFGSNIEGDTLANYCTYREVTKQTGESPPPNIFVSTWYLRKIISADRNDSIMFNYEIKNSSFAKTSVFEQVKLLPDNLSVQYQSEHKSHLQFFNKHRITSVVSATKDSIIFVYDTEERLDYPGQNRLKKINAFDYNGNLRKQHNFYHSYFVSNVLGTSSSRLKLDSLAQIGVGEKELPAHYFEYFTDIKLPSANPDQVTFYSQDHWGYYNGATNISNTRKTLIPSFDLYYDHYEGANKEPSWPSTKANILEKIYYPTGGYAEFEFEPNYVGMHGYDTIHGYFEEETFTGSVIKCDNPAAQIIGSHSFTITEDHLGVLIHLGLDPDCSDNQEGKIMATFSGPVSKTYTLEYINDNYVSMNFTSPEALSPGNYTVTITAYKQSRFSYDITYEKYFDNDIIINKPYEVAGGVRIKKIVNDPGDGGKPITKEYDYTFKRDSRYSTAYTINVPDYCRIEKNQFEIFGDEMEHRFLWFGFKYKNPKVYEWNTILLRSSPNVLFSSKGGSVAYQEVREKSLNGETQFKYYPFNETLVTTDGHVVEKISKYYNTTNILWPGIRYFPEADYGFPYPPFNNSDWARGYLKTKTIYDNLGKTKLEEEYEYGVDSLFHYLNVIAVKTAPYSGNMPPIGGEDYYNTYVKYYRTSGVRNLTKQTTTSYENDQPQVVTVKEFEYQGNGHHQLTKSTETTSLSPTSLYETYHYYPKDITNPVEVETDAATINSMIDDHIYTAALKSETYLGPTLVDGTITRYSNSKPFETDYSFHFPIEKYKSEGGVYVKKLTYDYQFEANGLLDVLTRTYDQPTGIVWGYYDTKPIAKVIGADPNTLRYSSFEANDNITIGFLYNENNRVLGPQSVTGDYFYNSLQDPITLTAVTEGKQILTYYSDLDISISGQNMSIISKSVSEPISNGMRLITYVLDFTDIGEVTLGSNQKIDEIRLFPYNSQVNSFTYDTRFGLTSVNDANNNVSKYEYDEFGRLIFVRDINNSITDKYEYNYRPHDVFAYLELNKHIEEVGRFSGTINLGISSNVNWSVNITYENQGDSWISSVNPNSGGDDGTLYISYDNNPDYADRIAYINVQGGGITKTLKIVQEMNQPSIVVTPTLVDFPPTPNGQYNVTVTSYPDSWTFSSTASWLLCTKINNTTLKIECLSQNTGNDLRESFVDVSNGFETVSIRVTQEPHP